MSVRVIFHPDVANDLLEAMTWFNIQSMGWGDRFGEGVDATLADLCTWPGMGSLKTFRPKTRHEIRSWPVKGFGNFLVLYYIIDAGIRVMAIAHGARQLGRLIQSRE